jgi:Helix-turn-helix
MFISSQQSRAARGLLHWKLADLAAASGLGLSTIKHFEVSIRTTTPENLIAIRGAFEKAGVIFESDGRFVGVRLKISRQSNNARPSQESKSHSRLLQ